MTQTESTTNEPANPLNACGQVLKTPGVGPVDPAFVTQLEGSIREVRRELALRRNAYPRFIAKGNLKAEDGTKQFNRLFDAHSVLMSVLAMMPIDHPHALERDPAPHPRITFTTEGTVSINS